MLNYKPIKKKDPRDPNAEFTYHACAVSNGTVDLRTLSNRISKRCTLTSMDIMAVLESLLEVIPEELSEGKIIQMGDFGSFRIILKSEGAADAELLTKSAITAANVKFRPGTEFARRISNLDFNKLAG